MRLTIKRNGKNVIPLLMAVCGLNLPYWRIDRADDLHSYLSGDAADKLAAYEDTGLSPEEIKLNMDALDEYHKAEAKGQLVILPCKVGDAVFRVRPDHIIEEVVSSIIMPTFYTKTTDGYRGRDAEWNEIGRTAFLTRAEAEAALKSKDKQTI